MPPKKRKVINDEILRNARESKENLFVERVEQELESLNVTVLREEKRNLETELSEAKRLHEESEKDKIILRRELQTAHSELFKLREQLSTALSNFAVFRKETEEKARATINNTRKIAEKRLSSEKKVLKDEILALKMASPKGTGRLKPFNMICDKLKKDRCVRVVKAIQGIVGEQYMDDFLPEFVRYIARNSSFAINFSLSPWDSFFATVQWKLTTKFLREFKAFLRDRLGIEVFSSVHTINEFRKRRVEALSESGRLQFDEGTGDAIFIAIGGEKGSNQTKVGLIFENVDKPNDPYGILLLGLYEGSDDHATLKENLLPVFDQLNVLESLEYMENGSLVVRDVKRMLVGDCKFISAVLNHNGQSSRYPCFSCNAMWSSHGQNAASMESFPFEASGNPRCMQQYLDEGEPILHFDIDNIVPPVVHSFLGLGQNNVVDWAVAKANKEDCGSDTLDTTLKGQYKILKKRKLERDTYETRVEELEKSDSLLSDALNVLQKLCSASRSRKDRSDACGCSICIVASAKRTFRDQAVFKCASSSAETTLTAMLTNDRDLLAAASDDVENLESLLKGSSGPTRQRLEQVMRDIGCDSRIWFQDLTGNQIRTLLRSENIDAILSVFRPDKETVIMRRVMECLSFLMTNANNAVKTDLEIDKIEQVVGHLTTNLRLIHAKSTVTPKVHIVCAHLVPYLRLHRSWGRLSEQGFEHMHAVMNAVNRHYASVRDTKLRTILRETLKTSAEVIKCSIFGAQFAHQKCAQRNISASLRVSRVELREPATTGHPVRLTTYQTNILCDPKLPLRRFFLAFCDPLIRRVIVLHSNLHTEMQKTKQGKCRNNLECAQNATSVCVWDISSEQSDDKDLGTCMTNPLAQLSAPDISTAYSLFIFSVISTIVCFLATLWFAQRMDIEQKKENGS
ncbi:unnamed protein product [Caenorhabditis sp. 36 PRJEB53466]|nr:unnamed protein product [Caenorhabditis sp. 36 PRJEB53466]